MSTHETKEKGHSGFGHRVKGAAHLVHGISENIRGSMLGAAESLGGTEEGKAKDEEIISKGRSEMEQGIAQMKGVTEPGGTAAGTESKVEGKIGEQPKPTELQGKTGDQSKSTESEGKTGDQPKPTMQEGTGDQAKPTMQEASSPAQAPPPLVPVQTADPQSLQAKPENSGKESASGTGYVQQSSQETQAAPATKLPQTGLIGEGADAPQGPGSSV